MTNILAAAQDNFEASLQDFKNASSLTRAEAAQKLSSQLDRVLRAEEGSDFVYRHVETLHNLDFFKDTAWEEPSKLLPSLVKGTLLSGHPNSTFEIISELRLLSIAEKHITDRHLTADQAQELLQEILMLNLDFALDELDEELRSKLKGRERQKIVRHYRFLLDRLNLDGVKEKLAEEIRMVLAQRPVVSQKVRSLIATVHSKLSLGDSETDRALRFFCEAVYAPGPLTREYPQIEDYQKALRRADEKTLLSEARSLGEYLADTSITNPYLGSFLVFSLKNKPELLPELLQLSDKGRSEWERYHKYVSSLALDVFSAHHYRGIYGLKRMLERNLFSRRAVRAGLTNLKLINLDPKVEERILKSVLEPHQKVNARQYLLGALIGLMGQPLGIGQGNNATCQSARGISMWAQHAPAKLINMLTTVATANNLILRFENQDLESNKLGKGLVDQLDYKLDAVSVVMVPHLDKIYNEMMRRATGRGEDPHKWANPALYGEWIPVGFASAYSYLANAVHDFKGFVRLFMATVHPQFNGQREMVYPNPVGIFITNAQGEMLGFHAVSLLRVAASPQGEMRAYFLNPNNEGRQDWGQDIKPQVSGNGERPGESSLPVQQFAARTYAFHFNSLQVNAHLGEVSDELVKEVYQMAHESWGRNYIWIDTPRQW